MSKKGIITGALILFVGFGAYCYYSYSLENGRVSAQPSKVASIHSDILKIIAKSEKPISDISSLEAQEELKNREFRIADADKNPVDIHTLPFDVLVYISKSPTSVAGIQPKRAYNEITRRYMSLDVDDISFSDMLFVYRHSGEQEAINKWADNEDMEEIEAFIKESAETDPVAAFAYGTKHLQTDRDEAKQYLRRFAANARKTGVNAPNQQQSYDELIKAIDELD